jgi:hypothetical protein
VACSRWWQHLSNWRDLCKGRVLETLVALYNKWWSAVGSNSSPPPTYILQLVASMGWFPPRHPMYVWQLVASGKDLAHPTVCPACTHNKMCTFNSSSLPLARWRAESVSCVVEGVSPRIEWGCYLLSIGQLSPCCMVGSDIHSLISCPSEYEQQPTWWTCHCTGTVCACCTAAGLLATSPQGD